MKKYSLYILVLLLFVLFIGYISKDVKAEDWESVYFEESVPYVFAYGKPFPEGSVFICKEGALWKGRYLVKDYTGKAVKCEVKTISRREYETLNDVTRTF